MDMTDQRPITELEDAYLVELGKTAQVAAAYSRQDERVTRIRVDLEIERNILRSDGARLIHQLGIEEDARRAFAQAKSEAG